MTVTCPAQSYKTEKVDWLHPKLFKANSFTFKSDSVVYEAKNCKIFEIRTVSGVTGYYIKGDGIIQVKTKDLNEKCTAAMFRFNPLDIDSLIKMENVKVLEDDVFFKESITQLKTTFKHCYHSGMDAIIPDREVYAVDFISSRLGEILVSHDKKEMIYFNFTLRTKM
jgi:hypothetical protein